MKITKKIITLVISVMMVMSLVGCGNSNSDHISVNLENKNKFDLTSVSETTDGTLENYYAVEENYNNLMSSLKDVYDEYNGIYSNIAFNVSGNCITYVYTYSMNINEESAKEGIMESLDGYEDSTWSVIREELVGESGVTDPITVVYQYKSVNGKVIAEYSKVIE